MLEDYKRGKELARYGHFIPENASKDLENGYNAELKSKFTYQRSLTKHHRTYCPKSDTGCANNFDGTWNIECFICEKVLGQWPKVEG
jgi:hypothetical protein